MCEIQTGHVCWGHEFSWRRARVSSEVGVCRMRGGSGCSNPLPHEDGHPEFPTKGFKLYLPAICFVLVADAQLRLQKSRIGTFVIARSFKIGVMTILRDNMLSVDPSYHYSLVPVYISQGPALKQMVVLKGHLRKLFTEIWKELRDPVRMG